MNRKLIITEDGSHSIAIPGCNVLYHSIHGAIQESKHVFVEAGLNYVLNNSSLEELNIFEAGFGTGLNVFLTALESEKQQVKIHYTAVEQFPLSVDEAKRLNYSELLQHKELFQQIHECKWESDVMIAENFILRKENLDLITYSTNNQFHLIYYDVFDPNTQPELWTKEIFEKMFNMLQPGGILVTYCCKGEVRRAMMASGFVVKRLPGPPGKREILRVSKI